MRTIKFRARDLKTGDTVYGDYITPWETENPKIRMCRDYHRNELGHTIASCMYHEVDAKTVEQLIAVDRNGKEVYEGDYIYDDDSSRAATFDWYLDIVNGRCIYVEIQGGISHGQDERRGKESTRRRSEGRS